MKNFKAVAGAALLAVGGATLSARAQLVVAQDGSATTPEILLIDMSGASGVRTLVSGIAVGGLAADDAGRTLYFTSEGFGATLYKAAYTSSGMLAVEEVGLILPEEVDMTGLAWDSVDNRLIGFQRQGDDVASVYVINTAQDVPNPGDAGSLTLLTQITNPLPTVSFYGADFDPETNSFYGTDFGSTGAVPPARGLYRMTKPFSSTVTKVADFPTSQYTGSVGLAVGNGRAYLVGMTQIEKVGTLPTAPNQVFNLRTNTYETPPIALPAMSGATWAPGLLTPPTGTNLHLSAGGPTPCTVRAGQNMRYSVRIDNYGAAASGPVVLTVTLPPAGDATFAGSIPAPTVTTATELTYALPPVPGYGPDAYANVEIHLNALAAGATVTIQASATTTSDIDPLNNSISASSRIQPTAPTTASIKAILTTDITKPNSLVPGGGGAHFTDFGDPIASPSGTWWTIFARNESNIDVAPAIQTEALMLKSATGGVPTVVFQKNTTLMPRGKFIFDLSAAINDSGLVAFCGNDVGATASDEFIATTMDGVTFTDVVREGTPIPLRPGVTYGGSANAVRFAGNTELAFSFSASVSSTEGHYRNNGNTLVVRRGGTTPLGPQLVTNAVTREEVGFGTAYDGFGAHSIYGVLLNNAHSVVVVDGAVAIEQGVTVLPDGSVSDYGANNFGANGDPGRVRMGPTGMWMVPERSLLAPDKIVRGVGGTPLQVYKTGDPIFVGANENWSDDPQLDSISAPYPADTFFSYQPGPGGHYVIGGYTDNPNDYLNSVLVYDNTTVIARANDPIDLDGNGVFDDDAYVRSFVQYEGRGFFYGTLTFTSDNAILVVVTVRDGASALCQETDKDNVYAVVRIPLPGGACCVGTECSYRLPVACMGVYQGDGVACAPANSPSTCCPADFDGANGLQIADIFAFLNAWFAGDTRADFDRMNGLQVADIFAFLNAWFAGC